MYFSIFRNAMSFAHWKKKCLTLAEAISIVAKLGGYQGKQSEGPPGCDSIRRGLICLRYIVWGYRLSRSSPSP
ncbi:MAG: hypothetical protein DRR42_23515 [Gammaproteobacteria bacterium]|nr:MAG: hypothetical protein DRR42_23515 [Gammaproteobacteria bacterium]